MPPNRIDTQTLKVTKSEATALTLSWTAVKGVQKYRVAYKPVNTDTQSYSWEHKTTETNQIRLTGLSEDTVYLVRVMSGRSGVVSKYTKARKYRTAKDSQQPEEPKEETAQAQGAQAGE